MGPSTPTPIPVIANPAMRCDQCELPPRPIWIRSPTPVRARPAAITNPSGAAPRKRPPKAETTNASAIIGSVTRPAVIGLMPSTVCSHSDAKVSVANAAARYSAEAISVPDRRALSRERSSRGAAERRSITPNAASAAAATASSPIVSGAVQPIASVWMTA